jgi:signal transduction histidine kinase
MPVRRSLRIRFAIILLSVAGALLLVVSGTLLLVRMGEQRAMLESRAEAFAQMTDTQICSGWKLYYRSGANKFREIVHGVMDLNEDLRRVLVLSVSGEVVYDSSESAETSLRPDHPRRWLEDRELAAAAVGPDVWKRHTTDSGGAPLLFVVVPYFEEWGAHPNSVLYVFGYDRMQRRLFASFRPFLVMMGLALVVMAGVSFWLAGRVARPILQLTEDVRLFSEGRDHAVAPVRTGDEVQELSETFIRMSDDIRQQVEKLQRANLELATLDRTKTDLLANVSHELRTPLAAIQGYVEFIREGQLGPVTDEQRKGLEVCDRNADRLRKTIDMLLDYSRMELGRVAIRRAPFHAGRLVSQVVSGAAAEARKRSIALEACVEPDLRSVDGDRDRLTQVVENLVTNALKFTPAGGRVEVSARSAEGGSQVEICVADTGVGVLPEERTRIFDRLYQSDATPRRRFGGIGLGLAIVKSILDAHQTAIAVEERPGGGSVFRFSLPALDAPAAPETFPGVAAGGGSSGIDVLAIDDDPDPGRSA